MNNNSGDATFDNSLREYVADCVYQACVQVCGGSLMNDISKDDGSSDSIEKCISSTAVPLALLQELARKSVCFTNNKQSKKQDPKTNSKMVLDDVSSPPPPSDVDGKPHDIEVRIPLTLYHRWKNNNKRNNNNQKRNERKKQKRRRQSGTSEGNGEIKCTDETNRSDNINGKDSNSDQIHGGDGGTSSQQAQLSSSFSSNTDEVNGDSGMIEIVSNFGLVRTVSCPYELATLLIQPLEDLLCQNSKPSSFSSTTENSQIGTARKHEYQLSSLFHVQATESGILCITTEERSKQLQNAGRFPCPYCVTWCKGMKGLWWHQQLNHNIQHNLATSTAITNTYAATSSLAIVVYNPNIKETGYKQQKKSKGINRLEFASTDQSHPSNSDTAHSTFNFNEHIFELVKRGDLAGFRTVVEDQEKRKGRLDMQEIVSSKRDGNGSTLLLWAAGGGHLELCRYLIEICNCNPREGQLGKRSFRGRTALHWAARNGHYAVVKYLIHHEEQAKQHTGERSVATSTTDVSESSLVTPSRSSAVVSRDGVIISRYLYNFLEQTTSDGTTAFGWASWQGHLDIMRLLHDKGCNVHAVNEFGCNAALWCAQGEGCTVSTMIWLKSHNVALDLVNHNGHGAIHKAAQRGHTSVCQWLWENVLLPKTLPVTDESLSESSSMTHDVEATTETLINYPATTKTAFDMIAPDQEGFGPSDLAGMEGHEELARWLAAQEILLVQTVLSQALEERQCDPLRVEWLHSKLPGVTSHLLQNKEKYIWERHGAVRRMRSSLMSAQP